jgi:hypothetical protein
VKQGIQNDWLVQVQHPSGIVSPAAGFHLSSTDHAKVQFRVVWEVSDVAGNELGVSQHSGLGGVVSQAQEHLFLDGSRSGDKILPPATDSLNAEKGFEWEKAQDVFEDFRCAKYGAARG